MLLMRFCCRILMEENMSSMVSSGGDDVSTETSDSNSDNYPSSPIKHVGHGGSESVIKFKGIVQQQNGNWGAQIYANNHRVWLGTFKTEKEAAMAYDSAAIQLRNCDSRRNFPWTSITVEEPNFQSQYSQKDVLEMIKDGSYQAKFAEFLKARYRITESSIDSVNLSMVQKRGGLSCKLLFQKQLTPSDVGKLNRIVIPKKEAMAYFTEVSERVEEDAKAGVMADVNLDFFDRMMRLWKFRYCYWKSSQSFVLTRGWSRFVKDKKLKANDVIAFYLCEFKEAGKMVEKFFMVDPLRGEDSGGVSVIEGADDRHSNVGFVKKLEQEIIKTHPPSNLQRKGFRLFGVQIN